MYTGERAAFEALGFFLDFFGSEEKLASITKAPKVAKASARYYLQLGKLGHFDWTTNLQSHSRKSLSNRKGKATLSEPKLSL